MADERRVVVVGTGPAGAAAAWTLVRARIAVTVLEAGDESSDAGLTARVPGMTMLRRRHPLPPAVRGIAENGAPAPEWQSELSAGGLSNHWTCAVPRFAPEDFTEGEALGERFRWPITYGDLAPHYPVMERLLHIGGAGEAVLNLPAGEVAAKVRVPGDWSGVAKAAVARGHGLAALPLAYGDSWTVTRSGTPFNAYTRMLANLPRGPLFEIRFGARALRFESTNGVVDRVIYRGVGGKEEGVRAEAFIVGAGCLNSTRLLLESQLAGAPQGLGNGEGLLGRFLHDHPLGKVAFKLRRPLSIHPPLYLTRARYGDVPPLRGTASVLWSGTSWRMRSLLKLRPDKATWLGFNLFGTVTPEEKNGISLAAGRDADGVANVDLRLAFGADVERTLIAARERLMEILAADGLDPARTEWLIERPGNSVHLGGTARMHASPKHGVLDAWNRVYGAPNVLVVDAAAFTTGPEKNPTLTAMAIASRASSRLAADLRA
jgi:choline dehydrogenase-like flavoprotein